MTLPAGLSALVFMAMVMTSGWIVVRRTGDGGWVDVFWTFGTGAAGVACALIPLSGQAWPTPRQGLVAALVAIWSLRLGLYVALRVARGPEDARYAQLRREWGARFDARLFGVMIVQAPASALLALSILTAARRPFPTELRAEDVLGLAVLAIAITGESLADRQMRAFKADKANRGKVMDAGLWAWSRHPNYFFEWLGWLAYPLIAVDLSGAYPEGWLSLAGPAFMFLILTRVTGVPPLEAHMLRSKGQAYAAYQGRVSAFFPWPPKHDRSPA